MRHIGSVLVSAIGATGIYVGAGMGTVKVEQSTVALAQGRTLEAMQLFVGILIFIVVGLIFSALLAVRWSPVGTLLAGVVFWGLGFTTILDPSLIAQLVPHAWGGLDGWRSVPPSILFITGVPLILTALRGRRWSAERDYRYSEHPIDAAS